MQQKYDTTRLLVDATMDLGIDCYATRNYYTTDVAKQVIYDVLVSKKTLFNGSRQSGKTTLSVIAACLYSFLHDGSNATIAIPWRAARQDISTYLDICDSICKFIPHKVQTVAPDCIKFKNGSFIKFLVYSSSALREADLLIVDNFAQIPEAAGLMPTIFSVANKPNGRVALFSTPTGREDLFKQLYIGQHDWAKHIMTWKDTSIQSKWKDDVISMIGEYHFGIEFEGKL